MPVIPHSSYPGPPAYLRNGHLQTVVPSMFRKVKGVDYERERLELPDGDFLDLDWLDRHSSKLLILTHGLEGDSHRHYIKGTAKLFAAHGWDILAWNCRSCSGEMNRAFRLYNHGEIGDLTTVVHHALRTKPYQQLAFVGFSMGGNITLKYLGTAGDALPDVVSGAAVFSSPTDLHGSVDLLDQPVNRFYKKRFLKKLGRKIRQKAAQFPDQLDLQKLQYVREWRQFDEAFSAPLGGYRDANDFYTQGSAKNYLPEITVPTLLVNALNDPLLSPSCHPYALAERHPRLFVETPAQGGHVGFLVPKDEFTWAERRALEFLGSYA